MKILKTMALSLIFAGFANAQANICSLHVSDDLRGLVTGMGWRVTSEKGGGHNAHSLHYIGKALDISVRGKTEFDIAMLATILERWGYKLRDERKRPKGQRVWGGAHMHISIPYCR